MQTSATEKAAIDLVEHSEFLKLMEMLRPGYHPPNRHNVGNELLYELYVSMQSECKEQLEGKNVSMMLDGWSNP